MTRAGTRRYRGDVLSKVLEALRRPALRYVFLLVAIAALVAALANQRGSVVEATQNLDPWTLVATLGLSLIYVFLTMMSWRSALGDLGSPLNVRAASNLFFVTQVGKYLPGGVWNVVAVAELGADYRIPRRRSLSAMVVWWLVTIVTGLFLAVVLALLAPQNAVADFRWVLLVLPLFAIVLSPPLLNRLLTHSLRLLHRPPLESPVSGAGVTASAAWAVSGWVVAGTQVWLIAIATGMTATPRSFALALGGFALAWTVGFLAVVAPAGVGIREAVLATALAGFIGVAAAVVTVLVSRIAITIADLLLCLAALRARPRSQPISEQGGSPAT